MSNQSNNMTAPSASHPAAITAKSEAKLPSNPEAKAQHNGKENTLRRIKQNEPSLTSLRILSRGSCDYRDGYLIPTTSEDWTQLGEALATNTSLRRLDLSHLIYNGDFLDSLLEFYARLNENRSLRRLALNNVDLYTGDMFTQHLADLLVHNENLTSLSATYYNFGLDGTRLLSSVLRRRETSFRYLDLSEAGINDEACEVLVGALEGHSLLRSLELNGNSIQNGGCVAISNNLLKNPRSILVRLYLDNNSIDDEGAEALADGLGGNKCLKTLSIHGNAAITSRGYGAFSKALCNAPRIDDILLSNHIIQRLAADENQLSEELKSSLRFNQYVHKQYAANRKVAMHHFIYTCNMELFESISGSLVPLVLAMIADHASPATNRTGAEAKKHCAFVKEDYRVRHLALHKIIRLCPSVCERRVGTTDGKLPAIGSPKRMRIA